MENLGRIRDELVEGLRQMPAGVIITVVAGLVLSVLIFALPVVGGTSSKVISWTTIEEVPVPRAAALPEGRSVGLVSATLSAIPQTTRGDLLFRVAGLVRLNSGVSPTELKCSVSAPTPAQLARTPRLRAVWPRPTEDLRADEVPELMVLKFAARGARVIGLPIRDAFGRFSDSAEPVTVDWNDYEEGVQTWTWDFPLGTGEGPAILGFVVVFKTPERPRASISCGTDAATLEAAAVQRTWPVPEEE